MTLLTHEPYSEPYVLNIGPQHPSTHGVFRIRVAMDGQRNLNVCVNSPIRIAVSRHTLPLAQRLDYSHFAVVRTKLNWIGGVSDSPRVR